MTDFWILFLIFSTMYPMQPGRGRVTSQSVPESPVYQPNSKLTVSIGDSATLRCCVHADKKEIIAWLKQPCQSKPQLIVTGYKSHGETFYPGFQMSHFRTAIFANCFNLTILSIVPSDEAMYYCALLKTSFMFGDGTYLKINDTSQPALCDNSEECEAALRGNNAQEKIVLILGTALGFCALLIFSLIYFILRRSKCENSTKDSSGMDQEPNDESVYYAAVKFTNRKVTAGKEETGSSDRCL